MDEFIKRIMLQRENIKEKVFSAFNSLKAIKYRAKCILYGETLCFDDFNETGRQTQLIPLCARRTVYSILHNVSCRFTSHHPTVLLLLLWHSSIQFILFPWVTFEIQFH